MKSWTNDFIAFCGHFCTSYIQNSRCLFDGLKASQTYRFWFSKPADPLGGTWCGAELKPTRVRCDIDQSWQKAPVRRAWDSLGKFWYAEWWAFRSFLGILFNLIYLLTCFPKRALFFRLRMGFWRYCMLEAYHVFLVFIFFVDPLLSILLIDVSLHQTGLSLIILQLNPGVLW